MNSKKITAKILIVSLLPMLTCCGALEESEVFFECASPDGSKIATFYRVYGGGAAGYQYSRINIRNSDRPINLDSYSFSMSHGGDASIQWKTNKSLVIGYPKYADIQKATGTIFGTSQLYAPESELLVNYIGIDSHVGVFDSESKYMSGCRE